MGLEEKDRQQLIRDKYDRDANADLTKDMERLAAGEPLAYVIGWQPFLGLRIGLGTPNSVRPLIPRPETEWWTEKLIKELRSRPTSQPLRILDLCAGSGAIGAAILAQVPNAHVSFGEIVPELGDIIKENLRTNNLDENRADIRIGTLFEPFAGERFDVIAINPPYIPSGRELPRSVVDFEPHEALFSGTDGLDVLRTVCAQVSVHLNPNGEVWIECDVSNSEQVQMLIRVGSVGASTTIHEDLYGRPRLLVAHFT